MFISVQDYLNTPQNRTKNALWNTFIKNYKHEQYN